MSFVPERLTNRIALAISSLAVGVLIFGQFQEMHNLEDWTGLPSRGPCRGWDFWKGLFNLATAGLPGIAGRSWMWAPLGSALGVVAVIVATPLMMFVICRSRPLWYLLPFISVPVLFVVAVRIYRHGGASFAMDNVPYAVVCFLAAQVLNILGLFFVRRDVAQIRH